MNKKQEVYIGFNSQFSKTTGFSNTYIAQEVKELTDEEINWLAKAYSTMEGELNAPAFARAILRKASEK